MKYEEQYCFLFILELNRQREAVEGEQYAHNDTSIEKNHVFL
jgi:uncharacterized protein Veg